MHRVGVVSFTPRLLYPHGKGAGTRSRGDFLVPYRLYRMFSSYGIRCTGDFSLQYPSCRFSSYGTRCARDFPRTVPAILEIFLIPYRLYWRFSSYGTGYTGDFPRTVPTIQDFPRTVPATQIFLVNVLKVFRTIRTH